MVQIVFHTLFILANISTISSEPLHILDQEENKSKIKKIKFIFKFKRKTLTNADKTRKESTLQIRSDLSRRCDNFLFKFSTMTFSQMQMKFIVEPSRLDHATKHDCFGNCQDVENSVGKQEYSVASSSCATQS